MNSPIYLRRKEAGEYLRSRFGFCSAKSLAKMACLNMDGPPFSKAVGGACIYRVADLDEWAESQIGAARRSSKDHREAAE